MRARFFQKLIFYRLPRPKLHILCRISRAFQCCICMSTYRVCHTVFFPPNVYFRLFSQKKIVKSDLQATCDSNVYQSSKILFFSVQEIWGCDSNSAFTTLPSAAGTPLFMFLEKNNAQKDQYKISLGAYFRTAENAVVLCKNFDTESEIPYLRLQRH